MKTLLALIVTILFSSCAGPEIGNRVSYNFGPSAVGVASNINLRYNRDLHKLYELLRLLNIRCEMTAMSFNTEFIIVELPDFETTKSTVRDIIIKENLTMRVSINARHPYTAGLFEVWQKGEFVREEKFELYPEKVLPIRAEGQQH